MTTEEYIEDLKYDIFIHDSTESIYNLESENQMVKIGNGEIKEIFTDANKKGDGKLDMDGKCPSYGQSVHLFY